MLMLVFRKVTGSAVCNVTSDVGSDSALLSAIQLLSGSTADALPDLLPRGRCCVLGRAFFRTEVLAQIIQHSAAIGVGDDRA